MTTERAMTTDYDIEAALRYLTPDQGAALMEGRGGCGIAGIAYAGDSKDREEWAPDETAQLLFPALRHRGPHAFGWMTWDGTNPIHHESHTGDVAKMANLNKVTIPDEARWMVLHVRWATHGDTENQHNNHPIRHANIVGVHNGVLRNEDAILDITGREYDDAEVDSEAIFAAVNRWGHRAGLRKIEGDMAVVYARLDKPEYLYFAKNHGRPLVFARTKAGSLVFASELKILHAVFGYELTGIRDLAERQLVRVSDGKVRETCQFAPDPPRSARVVTGRSWRPSERGRWSPGSSSNSGITDYFDRGRLEAVRSAAKAPPVPVDPPKPQRLTKKQKARARRARLALTEATRAEDARSLRERAPNGLHYYQGMLVTDDELELLQEFEDDQGFITVDDEDETEYIPDEAELAELEHVFQEDAR